MTRTELKKQLYQYLLEKAGEQGRVEFTYDELETKFGAARRKLYMLLRDLRQERKLSLMNSPGNGLRRYKVNGTYEKQNTCEVRVTLPAAALKPVLAKELEKIAWKFIGTKDPEAKMELAEEFTKLFAVAKGNLTIETTARLPFSMLRDEILKQVPIRIKSAAPAPQEQEDAVLGAALYGNLREAGLTPRSFHLKEGFADEESLKGYPWFKLRQKASYGHHTV